MDTRALPPTHDLTAAEGWVRDHLGAFVDDEVVGSPRFRGGQVAADAALASLDVTGYAAQRNEVWPTDRRGATAISPYVRHGLLSLPLLWEAVADMPRRDRDKFRDELLWQEHSRHLYARIGGANREGLRRTRRARAEGGSDTAEGGPEAVWDRSMACLDSTVDELLTDGYLVNQTRMWLASHWAVREGRDWRDGEDVFFRHLLDGSRAANRAGWQWTIGTGTGKAYGFSRWQVEKRAPGLCATCVHRGACPIEDWPDDAQLPTAEEHPRLRRDDDPQGTAGPSSPEVIGRAEQVWLTAESLGDTDPALLAHPDLPAVFVFDAPLLSRLRLSGKRLVFLVETLAELAERRPLRVAIGDPMEELGDAPLAVTFAPVPGFRRRTASLHVVARHPWPWLVSPHGGSVASYSAWRKSTGGVRSA